MILEDAKNLQLLLPYLVLFSTEMNEPSLINLMYI